jgi:hypothetical protein
LSYQDRAQLSHLFYTTYVLLYNNIYNIALFYLPVWLHFKLEVKVTDETGETCKCLSHIVMAVRQAVLAKPLELENLIKLNQTKNGQQKYHTGFPRWEVG